MYSTDLKSVEPGSIPVVCQKLRIRYQFFAVSRFCLKHRVERFCFTYKLKSSTHQQQAGWLMITFTLFSQQLLINLLSVISQALLMLSRFQIYSYKSRYLGTGTLSSSLSTRIFVKRKIILLLFLVVAKRPVFTSCRGGQDGIVFTQVSRSKHTEILQPTNKIPFGSLI